MSPFIVDSLVIGVGEVEVTEDTLMDLAHLGGKLPATHQPRSQKLLHSRDTTGNSYND